MVFSTFQEVAEVPREVTSRNPVIAERFYGIKNAMENDYDNSNPPPRSKIKKDMAVWIIEKENYGTDKYKQGIVKDVLSPRERHPRGIKVRLMDGSVGRVQWIME